MPRRQRGDSRQMDEGDAKRARSGLAVGDTLPDLVLETNESTADNKKTINLKEEADKSGLVIFFYPRASTSGCTKQACGFRDNYNDFLNKGYQVFGMSSDKPRAQTNWKNKQDLPYTLLCDTDFEAMKTFGIMKGPKSIKRSHVIIEKGGVISSIEINVTPQKSVDLVVEKILGDVEEEEDKQKEQEQADVDKQQDKMDVDDSNAQVAQTETQLEKGTDVEADKTDVQGESTPINPTIQEQGTGAQESGVQKQTTTEKEQGTGVQEQGTGVEKGQTAVQEVGMGDSTVIEEKVVEENQLKIDQPMQASQEEPPKEVNESQGLNGSQGIETSKGEDKQEEKEQNGIQGVDDATKETIKENIIVEKVEEQTQPEIVVQEKQQEAILGSEEMKTTKP